MRIFSPFPGRFCALTHIHPYSFCYKSIIEKLMLSQFDGLADIFYFDVVGRTLWRNVNGHC